MIQLLLSILALVVGVGVYPVIKRRSSLLSFFDAFVLIAIPGLTLLHLIPHSIENAGIAGFFAVCLGFGIPGIFHHMQHHHHHEHGEDSHHDETPAHCGHHTLLLAIAFFGVIIHTILDGIGLSMTSGSNDALNAHGQLLALGVLFHRLPIGIFIGLVMVPMIGFAKTFGVAVLFSATTCIGFVLGHFALPHAGLTFLYLFQGLIAGTLLHIIFHNVQTGHKMPLANGLGALFGIAALVVIEKVAPVHAHEHESVLDTWLDYLMQFAPMWCIACCILAVLYFLASRHCGWFSNVSSKVLSFLDPQPTPAGFDGCHHLVSALGLICLFGVFRPFAGLGWWIAAAVAMTAAAFAFAKFRLCQECHEPRMCTQDKSFLLWTQSSWMCLIMVSLMASVIPSFVLPLSEGIESAHLFVSWGALIVSCSALIALFAKKRGLRMPGAVMLMFALVAVFHHLDNAQIAIFFTGAAAVWMYDYHPKDFRDAIEDNTKWHRRYIVTAALCAALLLGCMGLLNHYLPESPAILAQTHHHEYGEMHDHEHGEMHDHEHGEMHEHEHGEMHEHEHGGMNESAEPFHEVSLLRISEEKMSPEMWMRALSLGLFLMIGLIWLLRFGPRELFEIATGNRHHRHDPSE